MPYDFRKTVLWSGNRTIRDPGSHLYREAKEKTPHLVAKLEKSHGPRDVQILVRALEPGDDGKTEMAWVLEVSMLQPVVVQKNDRKDCREQGTELGELVATRTRMVMKALGTELQAVGRALCSDSAVSLERSSEDWSGYAPSEKP